MFINKLQPLCSMRPLALGVGAGSFSTFLLAAVRELAGRDPAFTPTAQEVCPLLFPEDRAPHLDWFSVLVGVLIGLLLGPVIDFLYLLRHSTARLLRPADCAPSKPLHRVLDGQPGRSPHSSRN